MRKSYDSIYNRIDMIDENDKKKQQKHNND